MGFMGGLLASVAVLGMIALASREIGAQFRRLGLPYISGFLLCGALAGPDLLAMISRETVERLRFVDEVSIAFIGFAAGAELYLREYRDRIRPILWVTAGITAVTMPLVGLAFVAVSGAVPAVANAGTSTMIAAALLVGSILVARSPSSAIAVIKELRAWGPFTRLGLGVTVIMDVTVIVLFTAAAEVADVIIHGGVAGGGAALGAAALVMVELATSVLAGVLLAQVVRFALQALDGRLASAAFLLIGWLVFALARVLHDGGVSVAGHEILLEPLLICMVAGVYLTNATPVRAAMHRIIDREAPLIFVIFFTLAGASLSLEVLARTWQVAVALFAVRVVAIMIGAFAGAMLAGEGVRHSRLLWMSFITQAGVGLGLAKDVALEFPGWGEELSTVIIAVIVLNQVVGPPLYRWVLKAVEEAHPRADAAGFDGVRDAIIFGHEGQAMALARQVHEHGWNVKLAASEGAQFEDPGIRGLELYSVGEIDLQVLEELDASRTECIIALLDDATNLRICELAYEHFGTDNLVVRAQEAGAHESFHELGVVVVDPSTAMISLLDHLVRSPRSTSLLLGMEEGRDVAEIQVGNPNLHGVALRDLILPEDALVLSLRRGDANLITHGQTKLLRSDWVTVLGSDASLEEVSMLLEGEAKN